MPGPCRAESAAIDGLDSKLPDVGTTIFTVMSALAAEHGAINLSQGYPDFDGPKPLLDAVVRYLHGGRNQYPPMAGVPELREAIAAKVLDCYGRAVDPAGEVTVTSGATEALHCAIHAVVRAGDEVIVLDPAYDSYDPAVRLAGGRCIHVPLDPDDYHVPWERVAAAVGPRTRLLVVNSPHNPSGTVLAASDLDALAALAERHGFYVLSDEVYEHIIFDGRAHASVHRHPALAARSFVVSSFGKTYHVTGWKIGYCVAPPALTTEFRKVHQFVTFTTITPVQLGIADFLAAHPEHHRGLGAFYQRKRDRFAALLDATAFRALPSAGTYFQLAEYDAAVSVAGGPMTDVAFARHLTTAVGVAVIPVSVFHAEPPPRPRIRFCFAKHDATLDEAGERLRRAFPRQPRRAGTR